MRRHIPTAPGPRDRDLLILKLPVAALALLAGLLVSLAAGSGPVAASWLSRILAEAGSPAGRVMVEGLGNLEAALAHVRRIPAGPRSVALAAHAGDGGHWTFVNRGGERFTVGTPEEMKRVASVLAPETAEDAKLTLHVTEDTIFRQRERLKELPAGAAISIVVRSESYPLVRRGAAAGERLYAQVRPSLLVEIADRGLFDETAWQLARPLRPERVRVLSLEPDGPASLPARPRIDTDTKRSQADLVDPYKIASALASIPGQTVLVTGRIEGNFLHFVPATGTERSLLVADLTAAAEAADVNLVILQSSVPRQPGSRNWLWQRVEVEGLDAAIRKATLSDFLEAFVAGRGQLAIAAAPVGQSRVRLTARPAGPGAEPSTSGLGGWLREIAGSVTGNVVTGAFELHLSNAERQSELDARMIPFLPAIYPILYLGALVIGLLGLRVAHGWWSRLWPAEQREDYAGRLGFEAARAIRLALFVAVFVPLAAIPAFVLTALQQIWSLVTLPARLVQWAFARKAAKAG